MASARFLFATSVLLLSLQTIMDLLQNQTITHQNPNINLLPPNQTITHQNPKQIIILISPKYQIMRNQNPKEIISLISPKYQIMRNQTFQKERMSYYQQSSIFKGLFYANQAPSTSHLKVISTSNCSLWSLQLLLPLCTCE